MEFPPQGALWNNVLMSGPPFCLYLMHKHASDAIYILADGFMLFH